MPSSGGKKRFCGKFLDNGTHIKMAHNTHSTHLQCLHLHSFWDITWTIELHVFLGQREYIAGVVDRQSLLLKTSPDTNNIPYNRKWGY
jgi:hypothetical protein